MIHVEGEWVVFMDGDILRDAENHYVECRYAKAEKDFVVLTSYDRSFLRQCKEAVWRLEVYGFKVTKCIADERQNYGLKELGVIPGDTIWILEK